MLRAIHHLIALLIVFLSASATAADDAAYQTLNVNGVERQWALFVPSRYDGSEAVPLVLEFHGTGSTPEGQQRMSDFPALAEQEGFIIAAPKAQYARAGDGLLTWNVDLHDGAVDDVAFVDALIDHLADNYSIDERRIFATGFSGGARMSSRVACNLAHRVAAIGPVGGVRYPEVCDPVRPVPVITFHGRMDTVNHYQHQADSPDYWRMGVEDAIQGWLQRNGCSQQAVATRLSDSDWRLDYPGCREDAEIVFHRSDTAGHTWPGTPLAETIQERWGAVVANIPATRLTWAFFEAHPMPVASRQQR